MGNDAHIWCENCKVMEHIGRAWQYKEELMNKPLDKDMFSKIMVASARFDASVKSLLFSENWSLNFMEEASFFVETHKDCKLWLINDYFGETSNGRLFDLREAVQAV